MFEYGIRVLLAGGLVFLAGLTGTPGIDLAWKVAAAESAMAIFASRVDAKGMMNPGIAGFFAVAEAAALAILLAAVGQLEAFGYLVLIPVLIATVRKGAHTSQMAPIAGGSIMVAWALFSTTQLPGISVLLQVASVMVIGLLIGSRAPIIQQAVAIEAEADLELRERFRKLRTSYKDLERKSRRSIFRTELEETRFGASDTFFDRLAGKLRTLTNAQSVGIYSLAQFEDVMVVRGTSGAFGEILQDAAISVDLRRSQAFFQSRIQEALRSLKTPGDGRTIANITLIDKGRIVGLIALAGEDGDAINVAKEPLEELSSQLGQWIVEHQRKENLNRRARQAEVLYELASIAGGASTAEAVAERVAADLYEILDVDHLSIMRVEDESGRIIATRGANCNVLDSMSFAQGPGLIGWLQTGAPELAMFDVRSDDRCPSDTAVKQRIGSFFCAPVLADGRVFGYLAIGTHRAGGLDVDDLETMRLVCVELGRALSRLDGEANASEGIMLPAEFRAHMSNRAGFLVLLEPLKRDQLKETYGKPAMQFAYRQFATRVRAKLPTGGAICRKGEGGFVAFLPGANEEFARSWANDAAATASLIGLKTPDGSSRIPLAMRAKVAPMTRQESGVFDPKAA